MSSSPFDAEPNISHSDSGWTTQGSGWNEHHSIQRIHTATYTSSSMLIYVKYLIINLQLIIYNLLFQRPSRRVVYVGIMCIFNQRPLRESKSEWNVLHISVEVQFQPLHQPSEIKTRFVFRSVIRTRFACAPNISVCERTVYIKNRQYGAEFTAPLLNKIRTGIFGVHAHRIRISIAAPHWNTKRTL